MLSCVALYAATIVTYKYNGSLECSALCKIRIRPDALYLTRTTVHSYMSKKYYIVQIPCGYMVDDPPPSGNFSAYCNVKEKQKRYQSRLLGLNLQTILGES